MTYEKERIKLKEGKGHELPYTLIGHTVLTPSFSISFNAKGIKKLVEKCHDEDMIQITIHDNKKTEYEIIKYKK